MAITSNADRVGAELRRVGDELRDGSGPRDDAARLVMTIARPPRRTGRLADSARVSIGPETSAVEYPVEYAAPVHALRPWIPRAIDQARDQVADIFLDDLVDTLASIRV